MPHPEFYVAVFEMEGRRPCFYKYWNEGGKYPVLAGFQSCCIFDDEASAQAVVRRWNEMLTEEVMSHVGWEKVRVMPLSEFPRSEVFDNAFPIDPQHLHEPGKEVKVVYRDGSSCLVSGDFMRKELLAGRWKNSNPAVERWVYTGKITPDHPEFLNLLARS